VSDIPELVDARDERWITPQSGGSNVFSTFGTGARNITRDPSPKDDFERADTTPGPSALGSSADGSAWVVLGYDSTGGGAGAAPRAKIQSNRAVLFSSDCNTSSYYAFGTYFGGCT